MKTIHNEIKTTGTLSSEMLHLIFGICGDKNILLNFPSGKDAEKLYSPRVGTFLLQLDSIQGIKSNQNHFFKLHRIFFYLGAN